MSTTEDTTPTDTEVGVSDATPDEDVRARTDEGEAVTTTPDEGSDLESDPDTFPRQVVEDLRRENAKYRERAKTADTLAQRLHVELVRATGRLADPTDLPYDAEHLEDSDALSAALDDLLERKPHLATRKPAGDVGQGQRGSATGSFSLLDMLKQRT